MQHCLYHSYVMLNWKCQNITILTDSIQCHIATLDYCSLLSDSACQKSTLRHGPWCPISTHPLWIKVKTNMVWIHPHWKAVCGSFRRLEQMDTCSFQIEKRRSGGQGLSKWPHTQLSPRRLEPVPFLKPGITNYFLNQLLVCTWNKPNITDPF